MKHHGLIVVLLTLLSWSVAAHCQHVWTLDSCITHALKENITVRKQEVSLVRQKQLVESSRLDFLPTLNGSVGQSFNFGKTASPEDNVYGDLTTRNSEFALQMSVPLTGQISAGLTLSMNKLNLKAALSDFRQAEEDVRLNVISGALQVLYQKEIWEIAKSQSLLSRELYEKYVTLSQYGKITQTQLLESKSSAAQDNQAQTQALNDYNQALLAFTQLLNLPSPEGFMLVPPEWGSDDSILDLNPGRIFALALENHAGVAAEHARLAGYRKNVRVMKSAFYPQISLNLGIGTGYYNISGVSSPAFAAQWKNNLNKSVMFTLSIPLFNRLESFQRVRSAGLQVKDQELTLETARQDLYKSIQRAYCNAVASREKYIAAGISEEAARELLTELGQKYELGRVSGYEYNEARTKWLKSDLECVQARYELELNLRILKRYLEGAE